MGPNDAKMKTLDSIIDMMDHRMLGGAKKKGAPVQPPLADPAAEARPDAEAFAGPTGDEISPEDMEQLRKLYEDDKADIPVPVF